MFCVSRVKAQPHWKYNPSFINKGIRNNRVSSSNRLDSFVNETFKKFLLLKFPKQKFPSIHINLKLVFRCIKTVAKLKFWFVFK